MKINDQLCVVDRFLLSNIKEANLGASPAKIDETALTEVAYMPVSITLRIFSDVIVITIILAPFDAIKNKIKIVKPKYMLVSYNNMLSIIKIKDTVNVMPATKIKLSDFSHAFTVIKGPITVQTGAKTVSNLHKLLLKPPICFK